MKEVKQKLILHKLDGTDEFYEIKHLYADLDKHFEELKTRGFKTIIIQNTSKYNKGEPKECFYDSEKSFPLEKKRFP